jgi:3-hydroxyisobutyrate dehydrogenase-like beta-hydroxyacid dehydrogenase
VTVVGIVSPGAMGSAVGRVLVAGGNRVVATVSGRSERTRQLAHGLELLPSFDDVVAAADVLLSIVPPGEAAAVADLVADAAARRDARPLVVELNAISPATAAEIATRLARAGLDTVDGSISGPPPNRPGATAVFLSGTAATRVAALAAPGLELRVVGDAVGLASAVKMCTASVYKGETVLLAQALRTARRHGVLEAVLAELGRNDADLAAGAARTLHRLAAKSGRYVPELREIAATQRAAGLSDDLFEAVARITESIANGELAGVAAPEDEIDAAELESVLGGL